MACCYTCLRLLFRFFGFVLFILYGIIPTVLYVHPEVFELVVFMRHICYPWATYYNDFEYYGLQSELSHNFYLVNTNAGIRLGTWHMLPPDASTTVYRDADSKQIDTATGGNDYSKTTAEYSESKFSTAIQSSGPLVLYLHGNAGSRCSYHRTVLYKRILDYGYQLVAFDYRGYADSDGVPSEKGITDDARFVFESIVRLRGSNVANSDAALQQQIDNVVIWGHSLGTGVTMRLLAELAESGGPLPKGVILEAPFSDLRSAAERHPIGTFYRNIPLLDSLLTRAFNYSNLEFSSARNLKRLCAVAPSIRVRILHAVDDEIIPLSEARALHHAGLAAGCTNLRFVEFPSDRGYGHRWIARAPEVNQLLAEAFQ